MTELEELTNGKTAKDLAIELDFQLKNGEVISGPICSHIVYTMEQMRKTYKQWIVSKQPLSLFLKVGDMVDEDIVEYFVSVLPPVTYNSFCIQLGEPMRHSYKTGCAEYLTLKRIGQNWFYTGIHHKSVN